MVREEEEHIRERNAFAGLMGYTRFMIQAVVQVLPTLDGSSVQVAQDRFGLVEVVAPDYLLKPRVPVERNLRRSHDAGNAELRWVDLDLEDAAQFLRS